MRRPAAVDLALDVHDLAAAEADARGDPRRPSEAVVADVVHRQSVHLPDDGAFRIDLDDAFGEEFVHALFDQVRAVDLLLDGVLDVARGDVLAVLVAGPVVGFDEQVDDLHHVQRKLGLIRDEPRTELDHLRHGSGLERPHVEFDALAGDEARVGLRVRGVALDIGREVGARLEELAEVLIAGGEHLEDARCADHRHLDGERDRLRRQRRRRKDAHLLAHVLEPHLPRAQRALQRVPHEGLRQHIERVDDEEAAVPRCSAPG